VAQVGTQSDGMGTVTAVVPAGATHYEVRAQVGGQTVSRTGRIFQWRLDRTIVAVDLDETISHTQYSDLFITDLDLSSRPFEYAPAALQGIAGNGFQLLYVSARPRWLHTKTRKWLDGHRFPPGPILHADRFEACLKQTQYKQDMLAAFRDRFPNTLIGIGDKDADDQAYGANNMLALILGRSRSSYGGHSVVVEDWRAIERFFKSFGGRLRNPVLLARVIEKNGDGLRDLFTGSSAVELGSRTQPDRRLAQYGRAFRLTSDEGRISDLSGEHE
jgi:hypothetical protein